MIIHEGSCHCGAVRISLSSGKRAEELGAWRCHCSFCRLHGASWTSDPAGAVQIEVEGRALRYHLGAERAEVLVCRKCGVVPAMIWQSDRRLLSVIRVECLVSRDLFEQNSVAVALGEEVGEKPAMRRRRSWTPTIVADSS